jgi:hypothetical protein
MFMREESRTVRLDGTLCNIRLLLIEQSDREAIRILYNAWRDLVYGMKKFRSRGVNLPEGISESAFCLEFNSARALEVKGGTSESFDSIDLQINARQQIKATSVKDDLTSFGPRSVWDELYWLDFYRTGTYDGGFDVYLIPNDLIYNFQINSRQTFREQQRQGRRPRLHVRDQIITPHGIRPLRTCHI